MSGSGKPIARATPTGNDSRPPRIELHVHLEGTVRPSTLREIARRNSVAIGDMSDAELGALYAFTDFPGFIAAWVRCMDAIRTGDDLRRIAVAYAAEAASHGAVYVEAIISPAETVRRGADWDDLFAGATDGLAEAEATHGVIMRLTPDIPRSFTQEEAETTVRMSTRYRDRGVVGIGLGGLEADYPPEPFERVFRMARDAGLGSVPHAGEVAGPASIRGAIDTLCADRIRHGVRAIEDPALVSELADRGIVLDVCPTSNVFTSAVASMADHPLPRLLAAGVQCSLNTDDPAYFGTDLGREHAVAASMGLDEQPFFEAGVAGALCDDATRARLRAIGDRYSWDD